MKLHRAAWLVALAACSAWLADCNNEVVVVDAGSPEASPEADDVQPACSDDTSRDPLNCGRCGHDCLGGACTDGECQPVVVASGLVDPTAILLDDTYVYFMTDDAVYRTTKAPGGPVDQLSDGAYPPDSYFLRFALDDTSIYYVSYYFPYGGVLRIPKTGVADGGTFSYSVGQPFAVDDQYVYGVWGAFDDAGTYGTAIVRVAKTVGPDAGASANEVLTPPLDDTYPANTPASYVPLLMAVNDASIAWSAQGAALVGNYDVVLIPKTGVDGGLKPAAVAQSRSTDLALDDTAAFWLTAATGSVKDLPLPLAPDGSAPTLVAFGQDGLGMLAADDLNVYFCASNTDLVLSCPRSGCGDVPPRSPPRVIASDQAGAWGVAVDATAIYFTTRRGGTVMRVAK
jgi:hypothetical protein